MSEIVANNPNLKSWVEVPANSDFPIQNLPFGVFKTDSLSPRAGSRIGDFVIDLKTLFVLGYFENLPFSSEDFDTDNLNSLMKKGKKATRNLRNRLSKLFSTEHDDLQKNTHHVDQILVPVASVFMLMPVQIGDYTDFYSIKDHATNVEALIGAPALALSEITDISGEVKISGERWRARTDVGPLAKESRLEVVAIEGATAVVKPKE